MSRFSGQGAKDRVQLLVDTGGADEVRELLSIAEQLGVSTKTVDIAESGWGVLTAGHQANKPDPLFPRRDQ